MCLLLRQDVGDLVGGGNMAYDHISGENAMLRQAKAMGAGTPCINFSELLLHIKRVEANSCVEDSTHVSGLVFRQTQEVANLQAIPTLFYEQVPVRSVLLT